MYVVCHLVGDTTVPSPILRLDFETMKGFGKSTTLCVALAGGSSAFVGAPLARSSPGLGIRGDEHDSSPLLCCGVASHTAAQKQRESLCPLPSSVLPGCAYPLPDVQL